MRCSGGFILVVKVSTVPSYVIFLRMNLSITLLFIRYRVEAMQEETQVPSGLSRAVVGRISKQVDFPEYHVRRLFR